ncbi:MAG: hypothetical protein CL569_19245 [Alphaproteobacteria bacterium]|nr:hypothetical protein [Alphaproteobacteria bacterium]|tara:strand:+ start:38 stop:370 length:333 start_codon:yes stop_codon:yes gene_type:complete
MKRALAAAALVAAFLIPAPAASEGIVCANTEFARADLAERHDGVVFTGLTKGAVPTIAEIWVALETGDWTLSLTSPQNQTCIFIVGEFAQIQRVEKKLEGAAWTPTNQNR